MQPDRVTNILIVDDEQLIRELLGRILSGAGYHTDEAASGTEALAYLSSRKYEAVTLDLMMPGMSGMELLKIISRDYQDIAVIISSAVNDVNTAVDCMKYGASDYLLKPYTPAEVYPVIERALQKREQYLREKAKHNDIENTLNTVLNNSELEKKEFLHSVAHEIRTPLTAVIAYSELLVESAQLKDEQQVQKISGSIKRNAWALNSNLAQLLESKANKTMPTDKILPVQNDNEKAEG